MIWVVWVESRNYGVGHIGFQKILRFNMKRLWGTKWECFEENCVLSEIIVSSWNNFLILAFLGHLFRKSADPIQWDGFFWRPEKSAWTFNTRNVNSKYADFLQCKKFLQDDKDYQALRKQKSVSIVSV
jgi:hypothetical protein